VPVIVTGKLKISTSRRQVLSDIDLRQTRFCMDWLMQKIHMQGTHWE